MAKKIRLDFSKVEERSGWNSRLMPEGLHEMKIVDVQDAEAPDGTAMWVFALVPTAAKYKTRRFPFYCKLQQNQLWKVRDLLVAAGIKVPKAASSIDPNKAVGKLVAGEVVDASGQYAGRSEVNGIYPIDALDGSDADDDEAEDDEIDEDEVDEEDYEDEEEDDEDEEDELDTLTLPELRKLAKSLGIDHAGVKKDDLIELIREEQGDDEDEDDEDEDDLGDEDLEDEDLDDEDLEDDEDEDEEEEPAPRRRPAAKKPAAKASAKKPAAKAPARKVQRRR